MPSAASRWAGSVDSSTVKADRNGMPSRPACRYCLTKFTPMPPGMKVKTASGFSGGDLGELGLEVELVERNVDLLDDLALVSRA